MKEIDPGLWEKIDEKPRVFELTRTDLDMMNTAHLQYLAHPETLASVRYIRDAITHLEISYESGELPKDPLGLILKTIKSSALNTLSKAGFKKDRKTLYMIAEGMIEADEQAKSMVEVVLSVNELNECIRAESSGYKVAMETFILMLALVRANMGDGFIEGIHALVTLKKGRKKGGGHSKKLSVLRKAIEFAIAVLKDAEPHIFEGRTKTENARAVWHYLTFDCCERGTKQARFGNSLIDYEPGQDPENELDGTLWQIENLQGKIIKSKPISFGKRFIGNVSEVFGEQAKK